MAHCPYEKLKDLEPAFVEIRKLEKIKEPKPGIFYLKSQGFLHFHIKADKIWADARAGQEWGSPIDIPPKVTKTFLKKFVCEIKSRHELSLS